MTMERPDLSDAAPEIRAYIEALEAEIQRLSEMRTRAVEPALPEPTEPGEPPTTMNVITISRTGVGKRTPRHLFPRQRRGGMGVFDLDTREEEPPALLTIADETQSLILFTEQGRTYRLPVGKLPESPVRARGAAFADLIPLRPGERIVAALPEEGGDNVALVGERGWVTLIRRSFVGPNMIPGVVYHDAQKRGPLAAACWISGPGDLFIATRQGLAIRFPSQRVPQSGCLGINLERGDAVVAVTGAGDESGVFLLSADGKGAIRQMQGFRSNKSPGGGGKVALKTDHLIGAVTVEENDDIFIISRLSKIIRFQVIEVPPKEGVVQGVNCIALRSDETVALTVAHL
jgi:DNA gyrase subunit A